MLSSQKNHLSKLKLLNRIAKLREELGSIIYDEQFKLYTNVGLISDNNKETKVKLLDEIIFLTEQMNLVKSLQRES